MSRHLLTLFPRLSLPSHNRLGPTTMEEESSRGHCSRIINRPSQTRRAGPSEFQISLTNCCSSSQLRKACTGSVRIARQAGMRHAASEAIVITVSANANVEGSRGLTLYSKYPSRRIDPSAVAPPRTTPPAVSANPCEITQRITSGCVRADQGLSRHVCGA